MLVYDSFDFYINFIMLIILVIAVLKCMNVYSQGA